MRTICTSIIGLPNAGKSTLVNRIVGTKVSITTPKAQTTRNSIKGIAIYKDCQIILIDTPGILQESLNLTSKSSLKSNLHKYMARTSWDSVSEADLVMLVVDAKKGAEEKLLNLLHKLKNTKIPKILILNKIDAVHKENLLELTAKLNSSIEFDKIFMISALKNDGVADITEYLYLQAKEAPWPFSEDRIANISSKFLAEEITREKIFMQFSKEIPYSTAVITEKWDEDENKITIHQAILVPKESHKKIIVGKGGESIKAIGKKSRLELKDIFAKQVHLFLFVKVKNWENNLGAIIENIQ